MLKRVSGGLFQAATGDTIQVFAVASANNGVENARYEYNHVRLGSTPVSNHPGCQFVVVDGTKTFEAFVVFSSTQGRYDLFQVNNAGGSSPLGESVTGADSAPLIAFRVTGVAFAAVAAPPPAGRGARAAAPAIAPAVPVGAGPAATPARAAKTRAGKKAAATKEAEKRKLGAKKTAGKKPGKKRADPKKSAPARSRKRR